MASYFRTGLLLLLALLQYHCTVNAQAQSNKQPREANSPSLAPKTDITDFEFVLPPSSPDPASPLNDEFFKPPTGFEKTPLGTILRYRKVPKPIKLIHILPLPALDPGAAWQVLYRTQNSVGKPEANIVTILVPHKPKTNNLFTISYFTVSLP
jgi:hypothetical protein